MKHFAFIYSLSLLMMFQHHLKEVDHLCLWSQGNILAFTMGLSQKCLPNICAGMWKGLSLRSNVLLFPNNILHSFFMKTKMCYVLVLLCRKQHALYSLSLRLIMSCTKTELKKQVSITSIIFHRKKQWGALEGYRRTSDVYMTNKINWYSWIKSSKQTGS